MEEQVSSVRGFLRQLNGSSEGGVKAPDGSKPPRPSHIAPRKKIDTLAKPSISYLSDGTIVVRLNRVQRLRWLTMQKTAKLIEECTSLHSQYDWLFFILHGLNSKTVIKRYRALWWLYKELIRINDYVKANQHPVGKGVFTERDIKVLETILTPMGWYYADNDDPITSMDDFEKDVLECRDTGKRLRWLPVMPLPWKKGEEDAIVLCCMCWMKDTFGKWLLSGNRCIVSSMTNQFLYTKVPGCNFTFKDIIAMSFQGINIPSPPWLSMVNFALMYYPKMIPSCEQPPEPEAISDPCRPDKGAKATLRPKPLGRAITTSSSSSSSTLSTRPNMMGSKPEEEPPMVRIQKQMVRDTAWLNQEQRIYPQFPDGLV